MPKNHLLWSSGSLSRHRGRGGRGTEDAGQGTWDAGLGTWDAGSSSSTQRPSTGQRPSTSSSPSASCRPSTSQRPSTSSLPSASSRPSISQRARGRWRGSFRNCLRGYTSEDTPTPGELTATIAYRLDGTTFCRYHQGTTTMGSRSVLPISVLKFEIAVEAASLYSSLKELRNHKGGGERLVEPYFADNCSLVMERVDCDLLEWLRAQYKIFMEGKGTKPEEKKVEENVEVDVAEDKKAEVDAAGWWEFIQKKLIKIFRDLIEALRHIYRHGYVSDGLQDSHSIILEDGEIKAKLTSNVVECNSENSLRRNVEELREMLVAAILWPYKKGSVVNQAEEAALLEEQNVPYDIQAFLKLLTTVEGSFENIHWLLDDSAFWTPLEKLQLIRKLNDKIRVQKKFYPRPECDNYIDFELKKLNFIFPNDIQDIRCREIFEKGRKDREMHESMAGKAKEEEAQGGGKAKEEEAQGGGRSKIFVRLVALFRNVEHHYNTPLEDETPVPDTLEVDEIVEIADGMFGSFMGSVCSLLRHSLGSAWFPFNFITGFEYMDKLLSEKPS